MKRGELVVVGSGVSTMPQANQVWVHNRKNTMYQIITVANLSGDDPEKFPPTVVYGDSEGRIWSRPLRVFREKFHKLSESDSV